MTLFLSDLHLGRGKANTAREVERDLVAMLQAFEEQVFSTDGRLYLVGDVFDQYMEYKYLLPKGNARFQGLIAKWTDRGIPVTYVVGNRDLWHLDYFEDELGVRIVRDELHDVVEGVGLHAAHGDGLIAEEWLYNRLRPLMQSQVVYRLFRMLLPGDSAFALARRVVKGYSSNGAPHGPSIEALRTRAREYLKNPKTDLVVFGHCHEAACISMPGGTYLNPGYWYADRTFGCLDASGPGILRWAGRRSVSLEAPSAKEASSTIN